MLVTQRLLLRGAPLARDPGQGPLSPWPEAGCGTMRQIGVQIPTWRGIFKGGQVPAGPAHHNVPTAAECACPEHVTRRTNEWQYDDAASCQITLDTCFMINLTISLGLLRQI